MKPELIIFDLDGTLVDTIPDIADVFNGVLLEEGFKTHAEGAYPRFIGWGLQKALEKAAPEGTSAEVLDRMLNAILLEYRRRPTRLSRVYPGIDDILENAKEAEVPMAVFTNKAEVIALDIVHEFFAESTFVTVVGHKDGESHKPDPQALYSRLKGSMPPGTSILYVGDSPVDVQTAAAIGCGFAGALWGYRSEEELRDAGSNQNFQMPSDLNRWLENVYGGEI